jgi:dTDP-4-dehydrorhamnose reductase
MLGQALASSLQAAGTEVRATTRRPERVSEAQPLLDLRASLDGIDLGTPEVAFLCAAQASFEACSRDPEGTRWINVVQTQRLAQRLVRQGCFVVLLSTSALLDGSVPFERASSPPRPLTHYARQKAEVEQAVLDLGEQAAVMRLTKVIHRDLPLIAGWRAQLLKGERIEPYADLVMAPVSLEHAVLALRAVGECRGSGIWQVSACSQISYAEAALLVARDLGAPDPLVYPVLADRDRVAHRPRYATLDTSRLDQLLGERAPEAARALDGCGARDGCGGGPPLWAQEPRV